MFVWVVMRFDDLANPADSCLQQHLLDVGDDDDVAAANWKKQLKKYNKICGFEGCVWWNEQHLNKIHLKKKEKKKYTFCFCFCWIGAACLANIGEMFWQACYFFFAICRQTFDAHSSKHCD